MNTLNLEEMDATVSPALKSEPITADRYNFLVML